MANGHGGRRPGAGRPKKPLADKILEGTTKKHRPKVLNMPAEEADLEYPERLAYYQSNIPGLPNVQNIWEETVEWLKGTGCLHLINPAFLEEYAIMKSRFYEMERAVSKLTPIYAPKGKNTLEVNPAVDASIKYLKQADAVWAKIWVVVAQNCETYFGSDPNSNVMAVLLRNKPEK